MPHTTLQHNPTKTPHHTKPYYNLHIMQRHTIPYHTHTIPHPHIQQCCRLRQQTSPHIKQRHTISYNTIQHLQERLLRGQHMSYHTISYDPIPYHTIPYHTASYNTTLYHTTACDIFRKTSFAVNACHTTPYRTLPYRVTATVPGGLVGGPAHQDQFRGLQVSPSACS